MTDETIEPIQPIPEIPETPTQDIQPTNEHVESIPATGTGLSPETNEHPAVSIIQEIESYLASLSLYGHTEQKIRGLVASLKSLF
jgi:hypothetical protein